jgi:DNA-binding transcriptional ArsR family regulator
MLRRKSARGQSIATALRAVRLLREEPRTPTALAEALGVSRATVVRLLRAIGETERLEKEPRGREVYYRIGAR